MEKENKKFPKFTGKNEIFSRQEVIKIVERFVFHLSDNGDPDTNVKDWMKTYYPNVKK